MSNHDKLEATRKRIEEEQREWDMIQFGLRESFKRGRDKRDDVLIGRIIRTPLTLAGILFLLYLIVCP